jgi:RNA polymerase sigma-70 factor (ECF subfamily)
MEITITDKLLLEKFKEKATQQEAFRLLLEKYNRKVYWQVRRIVIDHDDANDVVQNTFIKVWEKLPTFREDSQFYTWLFRIATNEALGFLQKKRSNLNISMEEMQEQLSNQLESSSYFDGNKTERILQQAILTLPEKQRLVFNMKYYENLKYEEMEAILGTSIGALKASYHHAVKKIELFVKQALNQ